MKYNIFINQKEMSKTDFDLVDGAILDYLYCICNSKNIKIEEQRINGYTWVDYNKLLNDNPLLRMKSKSALSRRVKKMENTGFIKIFVRRSNGHKLNYFFLTKKLDSLFTEREKPIREKSKPIREKSKPIREKVKPIRENEPISTIKDYIIKNKRTLSFLKPTIDDIIDYCTERNNNIDAETFFDFYESKDWLIGKNKMNNWKASVRTWEKRNTKKNNNSTSHRHQKGADYGDGTF
jgi:DNA-binding transcriptional regulator GbsR (MarR family)